MNVWLGIRCRPGALVDVAAALRELHPVRYRELREEDVAKTERARSA